MLRKGRKKTKIKGWMIRNALMPLQAWGEIILISAAVFALLSIVCVIFYNADVLGNFFIPVLIGYLILLTVIGVFIFHLREKRNLFTSLGPELYYLLYPREKRRKEKYRMIAERRQARKNKKRDRKARHDKYDIR